MINQAYKFECIVNDFQKLQIVYRIFIAEILT